MILKALQGDKIPVYGSGKNVRDWLYVDDHVDALLTVFQKGVPGETYTIGGHNEKRNLEIVHTICDILHELNPAASARGYHDLITFVNDRPGHDFRYAIDASKIARTLDWTPRETFETGIKRTVIWYLENISWVEAVTAQNYNLERLGAGIA